MRYFFSLKIIAFFLATTVLAGCSGDDDVRYNNPYLPDINVALQMDLSLPQYNNLQFPGNHIVTYSYGIKGIVVYCISDNQYVAYELTDPNHIPETCSRLTVEGITASCGCDDNKYEIVSGQSQNGQNEFTLKPYRVEKIGSVIQVTNF